MNMCCVCKVQVFEVYSSKTKLLLYFNETIDSTLKTIVVKN